MSRHIDYNAAIPVAVCFLLRKVSANIRAIHFVGRPDRLRVRCDHSLPRLFGVVRIQVERGDLEVHLRRDHRYGAGAAKRIEHPAAGWERKQQAAPDQFLGESRAVLTRIMRRRCQTELHTRPIGSFIAQMG
jgi:hypothetical protein